MSIYRTVKIFTISLIGIISFSCTLNYSKEAKLFEKKPNFIFKKSSLDRYEENSLALQVNFDTLEIYDADKIWAGEKIYFVKVDSKQSEEKTKTPLEILPEYKGFAGILKIDEKSEKYFLGSGVSFEDIKDGLMISGDAFFWDKTASILYGSKTGTVSVKKGNELTVKGKGFIANTLSREFEFTAPVSGSISAASEKKEDTDESQSE